MARANIVSYQWKRGELITNSPTLYFDSLYLSDTGQYSCIVSLFYIDSRQRYNVSETYTLEFICELKSIVV